MMLVSRSQKPHLQQRAKIAIVVLIVALTLLLALYVDETGGGGQAVASPDGMYSVRVVRHSSSWRTIPYKVSLVELETGKLLRRFDIHPVEGRPNHGLRDGTRVIAWDASSRFADIALDGEYFCRIYVPSQPAAVLKAIPVESKQ